METDALCVHKVVMKELLDAGLLHGDCLTITGKTVAENLKDTPKLSELGAQVLTKFLYSTSFWKFYTLFRLDGHLSVVESNLPAWQSHDHSQGT